MKKLTKSELENIIRDVAQGRTLGIRMSEGELPFGKTVNDYILKVARSVGSGVRDPLTLDKIAAKASSTLIKDLIV